MIGREPRHRTAPISILMHIAPASEHADGEHRTHASLRECADNYVMFREFFESAGIALHVLSADGVILESNPASQELLGYTPAEQVGRLAISLSPPDDNELGRELGRELRSGARHAVTTERRFFHKDGHIVWGQLTISRLSQSGGGRMIAMIQDITERKVMEGQLVKQAFQDELTGLANRVLFRDRLQHALARCSRGDGRVAVLLLDLDGFKHVNDTLGHAVGDELLQIVGRRIASTVRAGETVARLGGDEFAVVCESSAHDDDLEALATRLLTLLRMPVHLGGREVAVDVSIGIAIATPEDDELSLLRNADSAMYAAKSSGKSGVRRFNATMHQRALDWNALESELRMGVERNEFTLDFEPVVHLATGTLHGFDALLHWQHPTHGRLDWERIAPIAEHTGMTVHIGRWLLSAACRQAAQWAHANGTPLSVSVPVSGQQFASTTFLEDVGAALEASGLSPHRLQLDITERDAMHRPDHAQRTLASLKSLGVKRVIDHFGTGYSSLRHLQAFAVDALKIDRTLVAGMEQGEEETAMVHAIVALAKSLRVDVIARGVDEPTHLQFLREIGCHRGQGRLYSFPLPERHHS